MSPEKPTFYKMPNVDLGDIVYWYPGGDTNQGPHVAIVSAIGMETICCSLVMPDNFNMRIRDGVRHVTDPRAREQEKNDQGGWDHTDKTKALQALLGHVQVLQKRLNELIGKSLHDQKGT